MMIRRLTRLILAMTLCLFGAVPARAQEVPHIGISWGADNTMRWANDARILRDRIEALGGRYTYFESGTDSNSQANDVALLVATGVQVIVILAHDAIDVLPVLAKAINKGVAVIAYDRPIPAEAVLHISHDGAQVGRLQASALLARKPTGRYVIITGDRRDLNIPLLLAGYRQVLDREIARGNIVVGPVISVPNWDPNLAREVTRKLVSIPQFAVDAILAGNDNLAGGIIEALEAAARPGVVVAGQDGERLALRRIAEGRQTMTVLKDTDMQARRAAEAAIGLATRKSVNALPGAIRWDVFSAQDLRGVPWIAANEVDVSGADPAITRMVMPPASEATGLTPVNGGMTAAPWLQGAILLPPIAVDHSNLGVALNRGFVDWDTICAGLQRAGTPRACW